MYRFLLFICLVSPLVGAVPQVVLDESNLEKRSELALKAADDQISVAAKAYTEGGDLNTFQSSLESIEELTRLSLKSLQDSGKRASRQPKYFKRAELRLRNLIRRLETLENEVSVDDRKSVTKIKTLMSEARDQILHDIMSKR